VTTTPTAGITGIHHLTAISSDAQRTVDFYTRMLELRLSVITVDVDDPTSYLLIFDFGDHAGPRALVFRERKGAPRCRFGIGGTHHLAFATRNRDTLLKWKRWLTGNGIAVSGPYDRVYFESIYFTDPDGLILEIATVGPGWTVDEAPAALGGAVRLPPPAATARYRDEAAIAVETWPAPISAPTPDMRLRQMHHITAIGSDAGQTERFFSDLLGMRLVKRTVNFDDPQAPHLYWGIGEGAPGTIITSFAYPHGTMRAVRPGAGMTERFALSVPDEAALVSWVDYFAARGEPATGTQDHMGYRAITLRDPDGHVIEIAAASPGVGPDDSVAGAGRTLRLPPALEARRREIERNLSPIQIPEPIERE
jgi:glyoxalase family protein